METPTSDAPVSEMVSRGFFLPRTLLAHMKDLAKQHNRSLNGELVWALKSYISSIERQRNLSSSHEVKR